jgi:putative hydrolase of the HAD superfamily
MRPRPRTAELGVIWDFDGTLGERPGRWSGCVLEVLGDLDPGHQLSRKDIAAHLHTGFPWHTPLKAHPHLCAPGRWWETVEGVIAGVCEKLGYPPARAREIASRVRERYIDGTVGWRIYPGATEALTRLATAAARQVILSNHVPELPAIIAALGLSPYFDCVLTSAATGYEKPHHRVYASAVSAVGSVRRIWMIGDNPQEDYFGPRKYGIAGILVSPGMGHEGQLDGLGCAPDIVTAADRILGCSLGSLHALPW